MWKLWTSIPLVVRIIAITILVLLILGSWAFGYIAGKNSKTV